MWLFFLVMLRKIHLKGNDYSNNRHFYPKRLNLWLHKCYDRLHLIMSTPGFSACVVYVIEFSLSFRPFEKLRETGISVSVCLSTSLNPCEFPFTWVILLTLIRKALWHFTTEGCGSNCVSVRLRVERSSMLFSAWSLL